MSRSPGDRYDIVLSLGVLHHTADMARVLRNLRRALKRPGLLFLWIYGKHGRYNHTLTRRALAYLVATLPPRKALDVATAFVHDGGTGQALADLVGKVPVTALQREAFESPVWIADQFLVPHEDLLDMEGLLALVQRTGFTVECDIGRHAVKEDWCAVPVLRDRLRRLPAREQLIVQDLLAKPERYFVILSSHRLSGAPACTSLAIAASHGMPGMGREDGVPSRTQPGILTPSSRSGMARCRSLCSRSDTSDTTPLRPFSMMGGWWPVPRRNGSRA
ncbi:MAG: class I SAM-dependent methyltransferase [Ignavibacteriae bacterium]|nr:class I SAM-dependent methyltransferase [Ignavibacteriota bacterium]